jgi:hypothetical protein
MSEKLVKTTATLTESVWRAAKIRAVNDGTDLKGVIQAAVEAYLKRRPGKRGGA